MIRLCSNCKYEEFDETLDKPCLTCFEESVACKSNRPLWEPKEEEEEEEDDGNV